MRNVYRRSARISISINKHNSALISINKHHWTSISTINIYQHHSAWMKIHRPDSALIRVIPLSLECKKSEAEEHHLWGTVGEWSRSGRGSNIYREVMSGITVMANFKQLTISFCFFTFISKGHFGPLNWCKTWSIRGRWWTSECNSSAMLTWRKTRNWCEAEMYFSFPDRLVKLRLLR